MKYNNKTSYRDVLLNCIMKIVTNEQYRKKRSMYDRHVQTILFVMYIYTFMLVYFCSL